MQQVNGIPVYSTDPSLLYSGLDKEPTWFSAQGGVYKCIERSTNKSVAIKKYLVEEDNPYPDMFVMPKELVENEIYSMTKCVDSNILKLYAVHLHQEFVYLVMPLCTGGSLQQYVFDHHLTVGQLVHIITSIAAGLAKVHGNGYIHRDIKCDNIFLDQENNNIVIGDFGVVSILPAADSSVEEAGVVLFWSPELIMQKIVNHKIDIWALGIVILEVLNGGKAPYEDEKLDEDQIKQRILDVGRPKYPPNIPTLLVDLLNHCLDPDPHTRYSAKDVLQHPFLKTFEPEFLFEEDIIMSEPSKPKCRLPKPAFSVDKNLAASVPVKEKIANVIRKRQTMSDSNRSQGSRIPMLCILQPRIDHLPDDRPKLRSVKSVKLSDVVMKQQKTLTRSKTMPSLKEKPKRQPLADKSSMFRKRLPAGESRTARLTMGLSTNGRRQSYKERENAKEQVSPTLEYKKSPNTIKSLHTSPTRVKSPTKSPTRLKSPNISNSPTKSPTRIKSPNTTTTTSTKSLTLKSSQRPPPPNQKSPPSSTKKRPMSFGTTTNNNKKPIPENKTKSLKNNIKAVLRVH